MGWLSSFTKKIRRKNPAHFSYWAKKSSDKSGWTSFNRKHKIITSNPDPRYWVSPWDGTPVGPMVKGGKLVKVSYKVYKRRKQAVRYIKRTAKLADKLPTAEGSSSSSPPRGRGRRRYGVDDWY